MVRAITVALGIAFVFAIASAATTANFSGIAVMAAGVAGYGLLVGICTEFLHGK